MGKINKNRETARENYKLKNWSDYNNSLKNRGKITIWLNESVKNDWLYSSKRNKGGKIIYSDIAIEFCLVIKYLYNLAYRQTSGFIEDIFSMFNIDLSVPSYSQIQRRSKFLDVDIRVLKNKKGSIDLVIDSTGLKVYGEGEWKVRKHGLTKHRTWDKVHMGSDGMDLEIISVVLTGNEVDDAQAGIDVIEQIEDTVEIKKVAADGAYDKKKFRYCLPPEVIQQIPPPKNSVLSNGKLPYLNQRDEAIKSIEKQGRKAWKKDIEYHIRSKSEVNMFRFKKIFGDKIKSRKPKYKDSEIKIKCKILNKFVEIGMPKSYKASS